VIETIIQAQYKRLAIASIQVKTNPPTRNSRLFKNILNHIIQIYATMIRIYTMYRPLTVFATVGATLFLIGSIGGFRFLYYVFIGEGSGHIQSLIFAAIFIMVGFQIFMTGLVADLIGINRKLNENILNKLKKMELSAKKNEVVTNSALEHIKKIRKEKRNPFPQQSLN
jgi:hypothetical protein